MVYRCAIVCAFGLCLGCGTTATSNPETPVTQATASPTSHSKTSKEPSEVRLWSMVPQNEVASQRSVIGKRKSQVLVVSNPSSHGEVLHFQFVVNSVSLSGVFSAPGGQSSTFTIPTGSVQVTLEECKGDPQYFELAADEKVTLKCELTTDGDCCEVADNAPPR